MLEDSEVDLDFIFFDMPGTIKSEGVLKTLSQMDYIFVPISADRFVIFLLTIGLCLYDFTNLVRQLLDATSSQQIRVCREDGGAEHCLFLDDG